MFGKKKLNKREIKKAVSKMNLSEKMDLLLKLERLQLRKQRNEINIEKKQLKQGNKITDFEKKEIKELASLEKKLNEGLKGSPLKKVTFKDLGKAVIGSFAGIVSHFSIIEGVHFAENVSLTKSTSFLVISFVVGFIILYYAGFRRVKQVKFLLFLPLRLVVIYLTTIAVILISLSIFGFGGDFGLLYRQVSVMSLPAIIGACAVDLIGEE